MRTGGSSFALLSKHARPIRQQLCDESLAVAQEIVWQSQKIQSDHEDIPLVYGGPVIVLKP